MTIAPETYKIKSKPWVIPTNCTICGSSQIYFSGMAMSNKIKKEIASKKLMILNVFNDKITGQIFGAKIGYEILMKASKLLFLQALINTGQGYI